MQDKILKLKKLNAAYIAALEYDCCPEPNKTKAVAKLLDTGVNEMVLKDALDENRSDRPDEIALRISNLIKEL